MVRVAFAATISCDSAERRCGVGVG